MESTAEKLAAPTTPATSSPIITGHDVGMCFRLHYEQTSTLKELLVNVIKKKRGYRDFWAVRNVEFSINAGESVGIIGRNGSGKSTLLKIVAGVYEPTEGRVTTHGSVAPLIELGAGFNGELTGRENVFLNGAILGRSRAEMAERYERIVEFAELQEFMDVPVKNYSSGMYARLGFAIATDVEPDVLIVDEVLGVGDEAFQKKCKGRIEAHLNAGKTMLFVSHSADAVMELCQRALVLHHGKQVFFGETGEAIRVYREMVEGEGK